MSSSLEVSQASSHRIPTEAAADICVIGAGPAGLTVAVELSAHGHEVLVLESGDRPHEQWAQRLNRGSVHGQAYAGLEATRHRAVGGAAAVWNTPVDGQMGAKYVALEAVDFQARPNRPGGGWALGPTLLRPYYLRAAKRCGIGVPSFGRSALEERGDLRALDLGESVTTRTYRLGPREALVDTAVGAIERSSRVRIVRRCTVTRLDAQDGHRVSRAITRMPGGERGYVHARRFVLAGGAVENARLLLASTTDGHGLGNETGWVGRCFMEHPRDASLTFIPASADVYRRLALYDLQPCTDGTVGLGRLALRGDAVRSRSGINASATLLPIARDGLQRLRRAMGRMGRLNGVRGLLPAGGHGWSRHPWPHGVFAGMRVLINGEQSPDPDNRVVLGQSLDPFGVPEARLDWRWTHGDRSGLAEARRIFAEALEGTGLGKVHVNRMEPDFNAHHHAGTTRMHPSPEEGVVDLNCRIHSIDNVFVAGASVFPTAGFANPTLTVVALAIRLADHLAGQSVSVDGHERRESDTR